MIIQLYVLFPFMFELIRKYNLKALILLCLFSYTCIYLSQYVVNINKNVYLLQNAPGHIPEFALGIWFALNKDRKVNNIFGFLAVIVFVLGNFYKMFFPFTFLSFTFMMVWLFNSALKMKTEMVLSSVCSYIMALFRWSFLQYMDVSERLSLSLQIIWVLLTENFCQHFCLLS